MEYSNDVERIDLQDDFHPHRRGYFNVKGTNKPRVAIERPLVDPPSIDREDSLCPIRPPNLGKDTGGPKSANTDCYAEGFEHRSVGPDFISSRQALTSRHNRAWFWRGWASGRLMDTEKRKSE